MRAVQADPETGTVKLAFTAPREFGNPMGQVQGGFLCAMLDEAAAVAVVVKSEFTLVVPTLEMKTSFFKPVPLGDVHAVGRVLRLGKSVAFIEAEIVSPDGEVCAKASVTARPLPRPTKLNSLKNSATT